MAYYVAISTYNSYYFYRLNIEEDFYFAWSTVMEQWYQTEFHATATLPPHLKVLFQGETLDAMLEFLWDKSDIPMCLVTYESMLQHAI